MAEPARAPSCPCFEGCAHPDCAWDALSCACPAHGAGAPGSSMPGFEDSCDECAGCKAARNPDL